MNKRSLFRIAACILWLLAMMMAAHVNRERLAHSWRRVTTPIPAAAKQSTVIVITFDARAFTTATGFALGDGVHVATAWHNIVHNSSKGDHVEVLPPFILSPYWGEIFLCDVVAMDRAKDVAILRPHWPHHPGLPLSPTPLNQADAFAPCAFCGSRSSDDVENANTGIAATLQCDVLKLAQNRDAFEQTPVPELTLENSTIVGKGWSGCPVLIAGTASVAGMLTLVNVTRYQESGALAGAYPQGITAQEIIPLLSGRAVPSKAETEAVPPPDANGRFRAWANLCDLLHARKGEEARSAVQALTTEDSGAVSHLFEAFTTCRIDLNAAIASAERAARLLPESAVVQAYLGDMCRDAHANEQALAHARRAYELEPDTEFVTACIIRCLDAAERYEEVETMARQAIAHFPHNANFPMYLGLALINQGKAADGVESLRQGIALYPECNHWKLTLARVLADTGSADEAEAISEELIRLEPDNPVVWYWQVKFLIQTRPQEKAHIFEVFQHAVELNAKQEKPTYSQEDLDTLRDSITSLPAY